MLLQNICTGCTVCLRTRRRFFCVEVLAAGKGDQNWKEGMLSETIPDSRETGYLPLRGFQPTNKPKARGRQRSLEAEASILKATLDLLERKPLREVTADMIARRAGVSKATIYKW